MQLRGITLPIRDNSDSWRLDFCNRAWILLAPWQWPCGELCLGRSQWWSIGSRRQYCLLLPRSVVPTSEFDYQFHQPLRFSSTDTNALIGRRQEDFVVILVSRVPCLGAVQLLKRQYEYEFLFFLPLIFPPVFNED